MLAADQRLRRADDFAIVIRRGRRAGRGGLVVHLRRQPSAEVPSRAGFVVPRAVGPAVTRNKVRRRLRHLIRTELSRLSPGTDVVVRVLPPAASSSFAELGADLATALAAAARPASRRSEEARPAATRPREGGSTIA